MKDGEGSNGEGFDSMSIKRRVIVMAVVAVMVLSALSLLAGTRIAAAAGTSGPLIFKASKDLNVINTQNPLRFGIVDEYMQGYAIWETLTTFDGDLNRIPWLAYSYQDLGVLPGALGQTFEFNLVRNACFLDHTVVGLANQQAYCAAHPMTANDVVFSYNMLVYLHKHRDPSPTLDAYVANMPYPAAKYVNKYTVDLTFTTDAAVKLGRPQAYAPWFTTFANIPILPEYQWGPIFNNGSYSGGGGPVNYEPINMIGTGPFLQSFQNTGLLEIKKNPFWWGTQAYNLEVRPDVVQYIGYSDLESAKLALLAGDVDLDLAPTEADYTGSLIGATVGGLPVQRYAQTTFGFVYEDPNVNVVTPETRAAITKWAHGKNNPALLRDDVRRAIHMTVDNQQQLSKALSGIGGLGETLVPSVNPWHYSIPEPKVHFDILGARTLLNNNGWVYNGTYAIANPTGGNTRLEPNAPPGIILAADWVCNNDPFGTVAGKYKGTVGADSRGYCQDSHIATGIYDGELLRFRFSTLIELPSWEKLYRLQQNWAALAGIRLMDGSGGECGGERGCGILSEFTMIALWVNLDYDLWDWDWTGLGPTADPGPAILWLETTMAIEASYQDNGWSDPIYDSQYNTSIIVAGFPNADTCRRRGYLSGTCQGDAIWANYTDKNRVLHSNYYYGTDYMQQYLYDYDSYIIALEGAQPYAFHELTWSGFGDWNVHRGLSPDFSIYWLYFQISPNTQKAPRVSPLPPFQALSGTAVTLTALATDSDGPSGPNPTLTYVWDLDTTVDTSGDGVPSNDVDATGASVTVTRTVSGDTTFGINVRVSDGQWTTKAQTTLTVFVLADPTRGPVVNGLTFTPQDPWVSASATDPVTFLASAFSKAGQTLTYRWAFGDGTGDTTSNSRQVSHTYTTTGTFTATAYATDTQGRSAQLGAIAKVGTNAFPFVSELPAVQAVNGTLVNFTALASDLNGRDILSYVWDFGDSTTGTGPRTQHTYLAGPPPYTSFLTLTYGLTVTDSVGQATRKTGTVYVIPNVNQAPTISPATCTVAGVTCGAFVYTRQTVTITVTASDPEGNPLKAVFTYPDPIINNLKTNSTLTHPATAQNTVVTFSLNVQIQDAGGQERISYTVSDTKGASQSAYIQLNVKTNHLPTLSSTYSFTGATVSFGSAVTYTVQPIDSDGDTMRYTINYGDGATASATVSTLTILRLTHTYNIIAGKMNVLLTLDDQHGGVVSFTPSPTTNILGTLVSFPFPFVAGRQPGATAGGNLVIGLSQLHLGIAASSTIDVVGAVPLGGAVGAATDSGVLGGLLDIEAVSADGTRVTFNSNLMGLGGRGSNGYTKIVNPTLPVRQAGTTDGSGFGVYDSETARTTSLAADAAAGSTTLTLASTTGFNAGDQVQVDTGTNAEVRYATAVSATTITLDRATTLGHLTGASVFRGNNRRLVNADGSVDDYAYFAITYNVLADRYDLVAAGLSGFATRTMTQLIALNVAGPLASGNVLTGTGVVVRFHDNAPADNVYETYQVVDGSGGAVKMASAAPLPGPARVARLFALGNSQIHGVASAASTIDVVGGVTLASKMGRDARVAGTGAIWAALDSEVVSLDGTTLLNRVDNLLSIGGRGNNLVTRYYNASLIVRQAGPFDGTGRGIYNSASGFNWQRLVVLIPGTTTIDYTQDYAMDSYTLDAANGNRIAEAVVGLSGFATRQASVSLATDPTIQRGGNHGIVISLKDSGGDNTYELISIADLAA